MRLPRLTELRRTDSEGRIGRGVSCRSSGAGTRASFGGGGDGVGGLMSSAESVIGPRLCSCVPPSLLPSEPATCLAAVAAEACGCVVWGFAFGGAGCCGGALLEGSALSSVSAPAT